MTENNERQSARVSFEGGSGYTLAGIVDAPSKPPIARVIFSHCFTCGKDLKMIVRMSRLLADLGVAVLRFDMTGLGASKGDFSQTNFSTNVADLQAAAKFLASEYGPPQFLIGHSFGGAASLAVTSETESVIGTITLAAPSDTSHLADVLAKMNPDIEHSGNGAVTIGGRSFEIRQQMLDDFRSHDLPQRIASIEKPLLAFHSPTDTTVSYQHALQIVPREQIASGFKNVPPRSLITLPGSDHLLTSDERDIPFVARNIVAWIERFVTQVSA